MSGVCNRSKLFGKHGKSRIPIASLATNSAPPVDGRAALLRFAEVETLFHEFGHALQHMLTVIDYGMAAGINGVEWDAVELPSQFMENWCYHKETLLGLSAHIDTGAPISEQLFEKLFAARTFRAASAMMRQLRFAAVDIELHHRFRAEGGKTPLSIEQRIAGEYSVLPSLPEERFLNSFGHIFAGGYASGYYSYKWAEVLSADAFAAFEEAGLNQPEALQRVGTAFRDTVLSLGGSRPAMDVFVAFRGREPQAEHLLRHSGLLKAH